MKEAYGFIALALGVAMIGTVGCVSQPRIISVQNTPTSVRVDTPNLISEDRDSMRVSIHTTAESDGAKAMAKKFVTAIEGQLASDGYGVYLADTNGADVVVSMVVTESCFDKSGNYYVMDAAIPRIEAIAVKNSKKLINAEAISTVRSDRLLGEEAALDSATQKLIPAVRKFVRDNVTLEKMGIQASVVELMIRKDAEDALIIMNDFAKVVSGMDGVYRCSIIAGDAETSVWKVRIVYEKRLYPNSIMAEIVKKFKKKFNLEVSQRGIY